MNEWLPRTEAAKRLGVSPNTLKSRKHRNLIETKRDKNGRLLFAVPKQSAITSDEWDALRELMPQQEEVKHAPSQSGSTYSILSLFDVHVPDADAFAFKAVLDFARDKQPDHIVIGGDFLELESCSQHGGNPSPLALVDEIKAGRKALARIREACPNASLTYLEGNHETRLRRVVASNLPTFDGAIDVPNLLDLGTIGCDRVP